MQSDANTVFGNPVPQLAKLYPDISKYVYTNKDTYVVVLFRPCGSDG